MGKIPSKISIHSRGLRHRIQIAFCLTTVIPILLLLNYIFPGMGFSSFLKSNIGVVLAISLIFAMLGFFILKGIIDSIVKLSSTAKGIAGGYIDSVSPLQATDEIGSLHKSLHIISKKVENLETEDALTGLYKESFIRKRLDEEIHRAMNFQRPCAFIMIELDNFRNLVTVFGIKEGEDTLKKISNILKDHIREVDKIARFSEEKFAIVIPEMNKRQALEFAEEIRKKIAAVFGAEEETKKRLTITGAVTENPIDGVSAEELISKAQRLLLESGSEEKNRIYS
ncbi:GGDEF domain-containing protein [Candidatus Omnitrophota bacterium]